jgi:PAS domain S-box-containing protein
MISHQLSRNEYRTLVEQAPIMIWRANSAAECDYFNNRWLRFRGRSLNQENGNQWTEGVHPEDRKRCLETYLDAFRKRLPFEMEYRLRRHDGVYRWILDTGTPLVGRRREFLGYIGSCIDVTDRVETQRALDQARDRELANLCGILPVCMECKRVRQADGRWVHLEIYIRNHTRTDFSHGLCPGCYGAYYKELLPNPDHQPTTNEASAQAINRARQAAMAARQHYKEAEEQYRSLSATAFDPGLSHADGRVAMRAAMKKLNRALHQYKTAVGTTAKLLSESSRRTGARPGKGPASGGRSA